MVDGRKEGQTVAVDIVWNKHVGISGFSWWGSYVFHLWVWYLGSGLTWEQIWVQSPALPERPGPEYALFPSAPHWERRGWKTDVTLVWGEGGGGEEARGGGAGKKQRQTQGRAKAGLRIGSLELQSCFPWSTDRWRNWTHANRLAGAAMTSTCWPGPRL